MASTTASATRWSDEEKIATLLAIIKANGSTPNWKETKIPVGRTMQSTQKMYEGLKKAAAGVEMVGADKQTPSKVMGPRKSPIKKRAGTGATNGKRGPLPKKRVRVQNGEVDRAGAATSSDSDGVGDDEDGEEHIKKRIKVEKNERTSFGEGMEDTWGLGGV